jgi:hypothetical protein
MSMKSLFANEMFKDVRAQDSQIPVIPGPVYDARIHTSDKYFGQYSEF